MTTQDLRTAGAVDVVGCALGITVSAHRRGDQKRYDLRKTVERVDAGSQPSGKRQYVFRGTVQRVDVGGRTITVDGEHIDNGREVGPLSTLTPGTGTDGGTLEVPLARATFPLNVKLHVKFKPDDKDQSLTSVYRILQGAVMKARQPRPGVMRTTLLVYCFLGIVTTVAIGGRTAQPPSSPAPGAPAQSTPMSNPLQGTTPDALPDVLAQLRARSGEITALMERGEFGSIYVPALQAKELALALETHRRELRPGAKKLLDAALNRLVRYAYLLDVVGDLGNRDRVVAAYAQFEAAERDVEAAFVTKPGEPR